MTIRQQSLLFIFLAAAVLLTGSILGLRTILLDRFGSLELELAREDAARVDHTLRQYTRDLGALTTDWANWDSSCAFVSNATAQARQSFIDENLQDITLKDNAMHALAFLDAQGRMIWSGGWDPERNVALALPQGLLDVLFSRDQLRLPPESGTMGLLLLPEGPMFVCARRIQPSTGLGPPCGTLVIARHFQGSLLADLREQTQTGLRLLPLSLPTSDLQPVDTIDDGAEALSEHALVRIETDETVLRGVIVIRDIFGDPTLQLEFEKPRTVMRKGGEAILYTAVAVSLCVLATAAVILWLLESRILSRIRSLGLQAERLATSGVPGQQVYLAGRDEISGLAASINAMLAALEESRAKQVSQLEFLQEEEQFHLAVLDSLQAGILQIDPKTHLVLDANAFAEKLLGRSREALKGRLCHGLLCPSELGSCPVTDLGESLDLAVRYLIDIHGTRIPVLKSATMLERNGRSILLESFVDITELQNAQERLRLSEETYRTIFTSTGAALAMLNSEGNVALANEGFARLSGMSQGALEQLQPHWTRFFPREAQPGMQAMLDGTNERIANLECEFLRSDGTARHISFTVADLPQPGWHILSLLDVTSRRQTEAALRTAHDTLEATVADRTRALEQAVRRLRELDTIKSSFLSSASHELRTPLTSIMGFAKLMERTFKRIFLPLATTPMQQERAAEHLRNLKIMQQEGERLTRLVNDLLDLNAIESGAMEWQEEPVQMATLLRRVADAVEPTLKPGVAMRILLPARLPTLQADPERLRQLFANLLSNAAKFTNQGAVTLSASVPSEGKLLEVVVEDTGEGIAEDILSHIFERFYQSAPGIREGDGLRDKPRGAGLGLAICREIAEHYGGSISVQSTQGQGSRFVVLLPLTLETKDPPQ
ncbi:CHASE4 domain-containing protein [Megalodesulfovibrio paquesii]